jgi:hypothetical protein
VARHHQEAERERDRQAGPADIANAEEIDAGDILVLAGAEIEPGAQRRTERDLDHQHGHDRREQHGDPEDRQGALRVRPRQALGCPARGHRVERERDDRSDVADEQRALDALARALAARRGPRASGGAADDSREPDAGQHHADAVDRRETLADEDEKQADAECQRQPPGGGSSHCHRLASSVFTDSSKKK